MGKTSPNFLQEQMNKTYTSFNKTNAIRIPKGDLVLPMLKEMETSTAKLSSKRSVKFLSNIDSKGYKSMTDFCYFKA